jgi:hypothetical protein
LTARTSLLRADLQRLAEKFHAAGDAAHRAAVALDLGARNDAEDLRLDLQGEYHAATNELADLLLMLLRHALDHRPEALTLYLAEALRPELEPLAEAVAGLEGERP